MRIRFLVMLVILTFVGVAMLVVLDYVLHVDHTKAWHYVLYHLGALLASIGSVGVVFEALNRSQIGEEWIAHIRHAFSEDPQLAQKLNEKARQDRVRFALEAQLDKETGDAIFYSMIFPYMAKQRRFREQVQFDLHLRDLDDDVIARRDEAEASFSKQAYHRLVAEYRFRRVYDRNLHTIGCILLDEYDELTAWFGRPDTLYREVACMEPADAAALALLLDACPSKAMPRVLESIFKISVAIDGVQVPVKSAVMSENKKSIAVKLGMPKSLWWGNPKKVEYYIRIEALRAKSVRRLPLLLGEPTANPTTLFTYPNSIRNVVPAPFFDCDPPFAKISTDPNLRQIRVEMPGSEHNRRWVFPPAGVIFTWDCP